MHCRDCHRSPKIVVSAGDKIKYQKYKYSKIIKVNCQIYPNSAELTSWNRQKKSSVALSIHMSILKKSIFHEQFVVFLFMVNN